MFFGEFISKAERHLLQGWICMHRIGKEGIVCIVALHTVVRGQPPFCLEWLRLNGPHFLVPASAAATA